jgi:hypothetical protein
MALNTMNRYAPTACYPEISPVPSLKREELQIQYSTVIERVQNKNHLFSALLRRTSCCSKNQFDKENIQ